MTETPLKIGKTPDEYVNTTPSDKSKDSPNPSINILDLEDQPNISKKVDMPNVIF